jgi:hypothetical protein
MCRSDVLPRGVVLPPAKLPDGQNAEGFLRLLCERALPQRTWQDEPAVRRRLAQVGPFVCLRLAGDLRVRAH